MTQNAGELLDKRGHKLKGAARTVREIKLRDGKGPRPPARGSKAISPPTSTSATSTSSSKPAGWRERLGRVW